MRFDVRFPRSRFIAAIVAAFTLMPLAGCEIPPSFPGAWIQGTGSLAITTKANGELWLENRNGVVMRLSAAQAGLTFSEGRYEIFIQLSQ